MTARFMDGTPYAGLEREMQRIPGFRPRKSGMVICHVTDGIRENRTREDRTCACGNGRKRNTGQEEDRAYVYSDYLHQFLTDVWEESFSLRAKNLSCRPKPFFAETGHRSRFRRCWEKREANADQEAWCAALYLLTADSNLWKGAEEAVKPDFIDFTSVSIRGVDMDGYVLYHTAKDLYRGTSHVSLAELTDGELVSDRAFRLVINAFLLCRYGPCLLFPEKGENYV